MLNVEGIALCCCSAEFCRETLAFCNEFVMSSSCASIERSKSDALSDFVARALICRTGVCRGESYICGGGGGARGTSYIGGGGRGTSYIGGGGSLGGGGGTGDIAFETPFGSKSGVLEPDNELLY